MLLLKAIQDEQSSLSRGSMTFKTATTGTTSTNFFIEEQSDQPHVQFLHDANRELSMLNKRTAIKSVFLRFNSVIQSSAPVERLFSIAAIILSKRRNRQIAAC